MTGWLIAYVASAAFSGIVSAAQIQHGCIERNPLAPSRPVYNLAFKGATSTGIGFAVHFTMQRSPQTGKALALTATGMNVAVGIHDAIQQCR